MNNYKQCVRILLLGDDSVGKTSMVIGLATEEPPYSVPSKAHDLYITADFTNQSAPAQIIDTCSSEQSIDEISAEILEADVICLVYSLTDQNTCKRVSEYWLPLIEEVCRDACKPVVIVGNKCDESYCDSDDFDMFYIRESHPQVEGYFRVSALNLLNLVETFQFSQKTVVHPIRPLIDLESKTLSLAFERALKRIFRIFDSDGDGVISWHEMLEFQKTVFKNLLYRQTLQELRDAVSHNIPDGLTADGFTFLGFIFIHKLFILRGMRDSIWKVLNTFGYNINLEYDDNYLVPYFNINPGEYIELNPIGIEFLKQIFSLYDKNLDGSLSHREFYDIFVDFPSCPFSEIDLKLCAKTTKGRITKNEFVSLFIRATHVSPDITLRALSILGFEKGEWHTSLNALQTTTTQLYNHYDYGMRTTFVCSVFGHSDSGKTSFLSALLGYSNKNVQDMGSCSLVAVINIDDIKQNSFIIFEEVPWYSAEDHATSRPFHMCILLFDASESSSFQFCLEIHSRLPRNTPCMFIATKKDISVVDQLTDVDLKAYCTNASRFPLIYCSIKDESQQFFSGLLSEICCFMALGFRQKKRKMYLITTFGVLVAGITIISLSSLIFNKRVPFLKNPFRS